MKIGIWAIFEHGNTLGTIKPNEGIGVYLFNIINKFKGEFSEIKVFCLKDDKDFISSKFCSDLKLKFITLDISEKEKVEIHKSFYVKIIKKLKNFWVNFVLELRPKKVLELFKKKIGPKSGVLIFVFILPILFLLYVFDKYLKTTYQILKVVVKKIVGFFSKNNALPSYHPTQDYFDRFNLKKEQINQAIEKSQCDVWFLPTMYSSFPITKPFLLLIYDMVTAHYPEWFDRIDVFRSYRYALRNSCAATKVGCMSDFVSKTDLVQILGIEKSKIVVVNPALPSPIKNFSCSSNKIVNLKKQKYLFYPTVMRQQKNILNLFLALKLLRMDHNFCDLNLVLTVPGNLKESELNTRLIQQLGLNECVSVLGEIDRGDIEWLYHNAQLAVISSFYEGIGLQLFEAVSCGCPLVCSDIKVFREQCEEFSIPVNYFNPNDPFDIVDKIKATLFDTNLKNQQQVSYDAVNQRDWVNVSASWSKILKYDLFSKKNDPALPVKPKKLFLFLQLFFLGGVWQATKDLINELVLVNNAEKKFEITLGVDSAQNDFCDLKKIVNVEKIEFDLVDPESLPIYGITDFNFDVDDQRKKANAFFVISNLSALKADVWFGLIDRFKYPLFPEKKYGLIVYDMIQERAPETFPEAFFPIYNEGIKPSVYYSDLVVTTNAVTQSDVKKFIGHKNDLIEVVPVSCEPAKRFQNLIPIQVDIPRTPFILNVSNGAMHKGIIPMLKGYAELKKIHSEPPLLVVCGVNTEKFSPSYGGVEDYPTWVNVRALVGELGLLENIDVVFLGHVSDEELFYLFENCKTIVNSSNHDNGSFNLIEGHYFGKPTISTRYDAAEWLYKRFSVPVAFFEPNDFKGLGFCIADAVKKQPLSGDELALIRLKLTDKELSLKVYAERFYNLLIKLAG